MRLLDVVINGISNTLPHGKVFVKNITADSGYIHILHVNNDVNVFSNLYLSTSQDFRFQNNLKQVILKNIINGGFVIFSASNGTVIGWNRNLTGSTAVYSTLTANAINLETLVIT